MEFTRRGGDCGMKKAESRNAETRNPKTETLIGSSCLSSPLLPAPISFGKLDVFSDAFSQPVRDGFNHRPRACPNCHGDVGFHDGLQAARGNGATYSSTQITWRAIGIGGALSDQSWTRGGRSASGCSASLRHRQMPRVKDQPLTRGQRFALQPKAGGRSPLPRVKGWLPASP